MRASEFNEVLAVIFSAEIIRIIQYAVITYIPDTSCRNPEQFAGPQFVSVGYRKDPDTGRLTHGELSISRVMPPLPPPNPPHTQVVRPTYRFLVRQIINRMC
jgi:hypothetical protein